MALIPSQGAFGVFAMTFGAPLEEPLEKSVEAEFAVGESLNDGLAMACCLGSGPRLPADCHRHAVFDALSLPACPVDRVLCPGSVSHDACGMRLTSVPIGQDGCLLSAV